MDALVVTLRSAALARIGPIGALLLAASLLAAAPAALAQDAATLKAKAAALQDKFASNAFGRPLVLESAQTSGDLRGDVYTVVDHPYAAVQGALQTIGNWCDILILHLNVKRCREQAADKKLQLDVGRKFDQPVEDAYRLEFTWALAASQPDYVQVKLAAAEGPLSTRDYRIQVEATPLDARRTVVHMFYAYGYGFAARMAINTYLGTIGSSKVGFTIVEKKPDGTPVYQGGVLGLLERNTMRYYLAIDAYLTALSAPPADQVERRIRTWYASTERYATQLHEMEQTEYLDMKRKEIKRQAAP